MLHRIRLAMQAGGNGFMRGTVEADETFIGGKARNQHKNKRKARGGTVGKEVVMGLLERHGKGAGKSQIRAKHIKNTRTASVQCEVRANVYRGSEVQTDALKSYFGLDDEYVHKVVDHAECYVKDNVHTNGLENFWSLLKRSLKGTYVSVEPFHLFRYLDEQCFPIQQARGIGPNAILGIDIVGRWQAADIQRSDRGRALAALFCCGLCFFLRFVQLHLLIEFRLRNVHQLLRERFKRLVFRWLSFLTCHIGYSLIGFATSS
jgi:hypothetical protein